MADKVLIREGAIYRQRIRLGNGEFRDVYWCVILYDKQQSAWLVAKYARLDTPRPETGKLWGPPRKVLHTDNSVFDGLEYISQVEDLPDEFGYPIIGVGP